MHLAFEHLLHSKPQSTLDHQPFASSESYPHLGEADSVLEVVTDSELEVAAEVLGEVVAEVLTNHHRWVANHYRLRHRCLGLNR